MIIQPDTDGTEELFDLRKDNARLLGLIYQSFGYTNALQLGAELTEELLREYPFKKVNMMTHKAKVSCYQEIIETATKALRSLTVTEDTIYKYIWIVDILSEDGERIRKTYMHNEFFATEEELRESLGRDKYKITRTPTRIER